MKYTNDWYWLNDHSTEFLLNGYIEKEENIKEHFHNIAKKAERILNKPGFADAVFEDIKKGYFLLPTPAITNFLHPTETAISCFGGLVGDNVESILFSDAEVGMLSKMGGGTALKLNIREKGAPITGGGRADGVMRFVERIQDTTTYINQRSRRGKCAIYLDAYHPEIMDFLDIKKRSHKIQEVPFAVCLDEKFVTNLRDGGQEEKQVWVKILQRKFETGFPYIYFDKNVNNAVPDVYRENKLRVNNSQLCTEILQNNSEDKTFVCALLGLNLFHFDEFKDKGTIERAVYLVDTFLSDYEDKANGNLLLTRTLKSIKDERNIAIGASGWHSYLQKNDIAIESMDAKFKNVEIFKEIKKQVDAASERMGAEYGKPNLLKDNKYQRRHVLKMAIAPNTSSSEIFGQWSQSIEPLYSNYYISDKAKNKRVVKNAILEDYLESIGQNTKKVWESIKNNNGSVQHLDFMDDHKKKVFKSFPEISQMELLIQNSVRQKYVDQGISYNVMVLFGTPAQEVSELYLKAEELGIKTLYYQLNQGAAKNFVRKSLLDCEGCAG